MKVFATSYQVPATAYLCHTLRHRDGALGSDSAYYVEGLIVCHVKAPTFSWRAIRIDEVVAQDTLDADTTAESGIDARLAAIEMKIHVKLEPIRRDLAVIKHAVKEILLRRR